MKIRPRRYDMIDESAGSSSQIGLIAQELREVLPELVLSNSTDQVSEGEDVYSVSYTGLIPVLIAGMQEQAKQIIELEQRHGELERLKSVTDRRIARIESLLERVLEDAIE